ncbi:hypothetical protein BCR32DRAFT_279538 [Anaeromyces robustus]|uniref:Uncharacterized protein n=1 Tax=Anaeromyces robustus TaxID=1754192 RepID=A0A1Y1X7F3_9FUNG|nr:hypothetical protein BCR32DRAFT_279538 [Anaeromyces robustus]|eukprot:ORX81693.1 hypothetical protein BCR32DRAFT_279538 [Anaeromyces robustus]
MKRIIPSHDFVKAIESDNDIRCEISNNTSVLKNKYPEIRIIDIHFSEDILNKTKNSCSELEFMKIFN